MIAAQLAVRSPIRTDDVVEAATRVLVVGD
jgi:hypothetical protein